MNLSLEFEKLKAKYYDPKNPTSRTVFKDPRQCMRFDFGIVEDNADPDKLGRIKVRFPMWGDAVSGWAPLVRPYASAEAGIWMLPDVGMQVICAFFNDDSSRPIALGSVYTPRAKPPVEANDDNHLKVFTTRSGSKIVLDEKDGEEKILVHTKDGKMRLVLDKAKGLSIVNEDGDISIKCKKLTIEGGDDTFITMKKDLTIKCENDTISMKAKGTFAMKSGKDVVLKASTKIKLKGSSGVTAGVKQVAKKDDMVVGVDMHDIQVPTNSGLMTIPMIPHPYVGKLADKLSNNVDVNDKAAATKGSKSKYDTPGHICMPPGVKFKSQPNNEGEVSSGTEPTVKINGKEAAVLGSMVKTCNDPQPQETCSIIAIGVPIILPIMMPGMDPDQFAKDGGSRFNSQNPVTTKAATPNQDKQPKLSNAKWSVDRANVGEEVTLSVSCIDQYENANVYFSIWKDGADTEKDQPVAKLTAPNKGGKAEAKTRLHEPEMEADDDKLNYIFTAKSYRCEEVKSGNVSIEKIKPEYSDLKWYSISDPKDSNTKEEQIKEFETGKKIKLKADIKNVDNGKKIKINIFEEGKRDDDSISDYIEIKDGKIEYELKPVISKKRLKELKKDEELNYVFVLEIYNIKSNKSDKIKITFGMDFNIYADPKASVFTEKFVLKSTDNSTYKQEKSSKDDKIPGDNMITLHFDKLKPGLEYTLEYMSADGTRGIEFFKNKSFLDLIDI